MPRRDWDSLSSEYRNRLSRGGITRTSYESGANLSAARGHANTPERPERASSNIGRFGNYLANRNQLIRDANGLKRQLWSTSDKWSEQRSRKALEKKSNAALQRIIDRLESMIDGTYDPDDWPEDDDDGLYYH